MAKRLGLCPPQPTPPYGETGPFAGETLEPVRPQPDVPPGPQTRAQQSIRLPPGVKRGGAGIWPAGEDKFSSGRGQSTPGADDRPMAPTDPHHPDGSHEPHEPQKPHEPGRRDPSGDPRPRPERPAVPPAPGSYASNVPAGDSDRRTRPQAPPGATAPAALGASGAPGASPESGRRLRDPGNRFAAIMAWAVIFGLVGLTMVMQAGGMEEAPGTDPDSPLATMEEPTPPNPVVVAMGRYAIGVDRYINGVGQQVLGEMRQLAQTPADRLRMVMYAGEVDNAENALERLDGVLEWVRGQLDADRAIDDESPPTALPDWIIADAEALRTIYTEGPNALDASSREALIERHRWSGRLALSFELDDADPMRAEVLAKANRFIAILFSALGVGALACLAGFALLTVAIVLIARGRLRSAYAPPAPGGSAYLESFALFLLGFLVVSMIAFFIMRQNGADLTPILIWLLPLAAAWPLVRGARVGAWRHALGLVPGRGVIREIGAGVVGYIACLPIFLFGLFLTLILSATSTAISGADEAEPITHPIMDDIARGGVWGVLGVYLLAVVWAPVVEELLFRGALYHHMRGICGVLVSAVVVAFIFAAIHPQGLLAIPALMGLAVAFALIREWRGSLIGAITAHALHNGTLVTIMIMALS
ncbi:MAG: CPBP family intramembrane metalloprotease [Phycisphaeraceae bacterium]|nr:MAG: CPBP family intramembrane metalloprotease [Phycisphaeraceae bacterium]